MSIASIRQTAGHSILDDRFQSRSVFLLKQLPPLSRHTLRLPKPALNRKPGSSGSR
jgi:hypothetical protein